MRQLLAAFDSVAFGDHTHYNRRTWAPIITCALFIVDIVFLLVRRPHSCALMNDLTAAMIIMIFPVTWSAMSAASLDDRTSDEPAQLLVRRTVVAACVAMCVLLFATIFERRRAAKSTSTSTYNGICHRTFHARRFQGHSSRGIP